MALKFGELGLKSNISSSALEFQAGRPTFTRMNGLTIQILNTLCSSPKKVVVTLEPWNKPWHFTSHVHPDSTLILPADALKK